MEKMSRESRSKIMASIRGKDTKPEMLVRSQLHRMGYRFRLHRTDLPGKPDICLPKHRAVIFVHGCFWHQHAKCMKGRAPRTNSAFWEDKFSKNIARDKRARLGLKELGWRSLVLWECDLADEQRIAKAVRRFLDKP